jgi:hypothetical protein
VEAGGFNKFDIVGAKKKDSSSAADRRRNGKLIEILFKCFDNTPGHLKNETYDGLSPTVQTRHELARGRLSSFASEVE